MGLLKIFFMGREIRKGINNPGEFLADQSLDFLKWFLIVGSLIGVFILLGVGVFGFTSWLGGPYVFFKVLFWVLFIPFALCEIFLISIFLKIKKVLKRNLDRATLRVKAEIKKQGRNPQALALYLRASIMERFLKKRRIQFRRSGRS